MGRQPMRARCSSIRYCPLPLGNVTFSKLQIVVCRHGAGAAFTEILLPENESFIATLPKM
jgi:hypothetical protein